MHTSHEHDDYLSHGDCGCGNCDNHDELDYSDEDAYDDPYEVVMYDIDAESDDLYALIEMLSDSTRSWYASRRLNALAASGPLSALVADIIIDSLGRRWNPLEHPRDRFGRFIETGGFFRWLMKGQWLRGQVARIDSDGVIHARSAGNDNIADGAIIKFKPAQASKLISVKAPGASLALSEIDLDADIPNFPEASATQRRIYNALQIGDMPAEDMDVYRVADNGDLTPQDFAAQLKGLQDRGLIEIDPGDKPRVRRDDDGDLGVISIEDDQIAEVPDDETPDLDDSPELTKAQRNLLDRLIDADRGENDGVQQDELTDVDEDDFQALIDAGVLVPGDDGNFFLENPAAVDEPNPEAPVERDLTSEIFDASAERFEDALAQEAFQHFAEELARPGGENNATLPEGLPAAKRRTAEAAANKWWEERNAGTPGTEGEVDAPEADVPEAEQVNPKDALNPRNQALADTLAAEWIPDDKFLDSAQGEEYRGALKRFFDAEDLDEAGLSDHARIQRQDAERALRRLDNPPSDETIAGWPEAVREARLAEAEQVVPEAVSDDVPEVAEDVVPEVDAEVDAAEALRQAVHGVEQPELFDALSEPAVEEDLSAPEEGLTITPDWKDFSARLAEEPKAAGFFDRLDQENRIADELGLDLHGEDAPWSWEALSEGLGFRPAELLFEDSDGSLGEALAKDPDPFIRQYENEMLEKFQNRGESGFGPDVMRLRQAGLIEPVDGGNDWRLTDAGRERLGLANELPAEESDSLAINTEDLDRAFAEETPGDLSVEEVDLPSESELADTPEPLPVEDLNPRKIEGQRGFRPEDIPLLNNDDQWEEEAVAVGAQDVGQAMWDAQNNFLNPEAAYEIAAEEVAFGRLNQNDLEKIQDAVKQHLESRGQKWVPAFEIDYVGDDQRAVDGDAPDAPAAALFVPEDADLVPAADKPAFVRIIDQPDFFENKPDLSQEGDVLDRNGQPVVLGGWYKSNKGGEGDPDQVVGFLNQEKYPGLVLIQTPDGKMKIVDAQGKSPLAGLNRKPDPGTEARARIRVQRAVGGDEILDLDQNNRKNVLWAPRGEIGERAEIGMRVKGRGDKGLFQDGDEGVIVRIGWNAGQNRPDIFVVKRGRKKEIQLAPRSLVPILEGTATPTPEPSPDIPNLDPNNIPDREWSVPSDQELLERVQILGGEVDWVDFANGFQNPGVVHAQMRAMVDNGDLEFNPEVVDGRPKIRVPGGRQDAPAVNLPEGADNDVEGKILGIIDGGDGGSLPRSALVNIEDENFEEQFKAITDLVDRGVLEKIVDENGRTRYKRPSATPEPGFGNGANNEFEADLLDIVDAESRPVSGADLIDLDAEDAADRMAALRELVDRRVLRRAIDPESGKPVYSRAQTGSGSTPISMSNDEASKAIASGADPMLIVTDDLEQVMRGAGYDFALNGDAGISENFWAVSKQPGPFPLNIRDGNLPRGKKTRKVDGKVYMVKQSSGSSMIPNDILNEIMAGALSEDLQERLGRDAPGLLYHPRVALASAPTGLGARAGGAIIMDHAAYGFPEGHEINDGLKFLSDNLFDAGASEDIIGLGLFDYLINNTRDRHRKNQMYVTDPATGKVRVVIIDNGFGFGASGSPERLSFKEYAREDRPSALLNRARARSMGRDRIAAAVRQFADSYKQMDVDAIMERIRVLFPSMSPEQEAYARQHLTIAKNRVDSLSTDIDAVVDAILNA